MTTPRQVWTDRITALIDHADALRITPRTNPPDSNEDIYDQLLRCYVEFVRDHLTNYFDNELRLIDAIVPNNPIPQPIRNAQAAPNNEYPRAHVMRVSLDQAAFDLALIERIIKQRRGGVPQLLQIADFLAMQALQPAIVAGLFARPPAVITYYQKSTDIRLIPYGNVALIGLPYSINTTPRDLMAIPHEVGHYVFWHGKGCRAQTWVPNNTKAKDSELLNKLLDLLREHQLLQEEYQEDDILIRIKRLLETRNDINSGLMLDSAFYNWQEEIFADVYGTLVAGPLITLDFQDLLLENDRRGFERDDSEHPIPVIRPYIYQQTLSQPLAAFGHNWHPDFEAQWANRLQDRGYPLDTAGQIDLTKMLFKIKVDPEKFLSAEFLRYPTVWAAISELWETKPFAERTYSAHDLRTKCEKIVDTILTQSPLQGLIFTNTKWAELITKHPALTPAATHAFTRNVLYQGFENAVQDAITNNLNPRVDLRPPAGGIAQPDIVQRPHADLVVDWLASFPVAPNRPAWLPVFKAAGWTLKGPSTVHTPPPSVY